MNKRLHQQCLCLEMVLNEWGKEALNPGRWSNPDTFWGDPDSIATFIYTADGYLSYASAGETHYDLIRSDVNLYDRYFEYFNVQQHDSDTYEFEGEVGDYDDLIGFLREHAVQIDLLGRIGYLNDNTNNTEVPVVSFWNSDARLYDKFLRLCLEEIITQGDVDRNLCYISTPIHKTVPLSSIVAGTAKTGAVDDNYELYKKLHLMRGAEKQAAMKKLGVGGTKPHPMQTAMDNANLRVPGQKWWAMNSEDLIPTIGDLLTDDPDIYQ